MKLTQNMQLNNMAYDITKKQRVAVFADWIPNIGNGTNTSV
jgi:hypothetical protein